MKTVKASIIIIILLAVVFIVYHMTASKKHERVHIIRAEYRNIEKTLTFSGTILPEKEIEIKSTISGVLEKLCVHVGEEVQAGSVYTQFQDLTDFRCGFRSRRGRTPCCCCPRGS